MARQYKNGRCSCWKQVNEQLSNHNTALDELFTLTGHHYLKVATHRCDKKKKPPKSVIASHCPFCGEKLKEDVG